MVTNEYRERLSPPWWVWAVGLLVVSPVAVAYGGAYGQVAGWIVYAVLAAIVMLTLFVTSPRVRVTAGELRAGRAHIPIAHLGRVVPLDAQHTRNARTLTGGADAYLVTRMWSSPESVLVEIDDDADPHPYWLITARNPQQLADAIEAARRDA